MSWKSDSMEVGTLPNCDSRNTLFGLSSLARPTVRTSVTEQMYRAKIMRIVTQNTALAASRKP